MLSRPRCTHCARLVPLLASTIACMVLSSCGGSDNTTTFSSPSGTNSSASVAANETARFAPAVVVGNKATFSGPRANYTIVKAASGYTIIDNVGNDGTSTLNAAVTRFEFTDVAVNASMGDLIQGMSEADLKLLIELYIAFFNRVPEADGLAYWIGRFKAGDSLNRIADDFYSSAIVYPQLTGYSSSMSLADFVRVIYRNVLGRSGATAPPEQDVAFWVGRINSGVDTKGTLIRSMLDSAHTFLGDPTWGWAARLLDNKYTVGHYFAVQQGLNFSTPETSIQKTMAIAAAITPDQIAPAIALIPVAPSAKPIDPAIAVPAPASGGSTPSTPSVPSTPTASDQLNSVKVVVKRPPRSKETGELGLNRPLVSVTLCQPGTQNCQTIDDILVDTGSSGLRILGKALNPALPLAAVTDLGGRQVGECLVFGSTSTLGIGQQASWGSVRKADMKIAGMIAANLSIEVVNDAGFAPIPSTCSARAERVTGDYSFNGILGIRSFDTDCSGCATVVPQRPRYYGCTGNACTGTTLPADRQVRNPVALFASGFDNGTVLSFPRVDGFSTSPIEGSLVFGIGSSANNQLGAAKVFKTDGNGFLSVTAAGVTAPALPDTGSPFIGLNDPTIPRCPAPIESYYCPVSAQSISMINESSNGQRDTLTITIVRPPSSVPIAASIATVSEPANSIDLGLPFYFGRTVFTAIEGKTTPAGPGPYIAY